MHACDLRRIVRSAPVLAVLIGGACSNGEKSATVGADTSARFESVASPGWDMLTEHDISEVMTRTPLHTVLPDDSAESAARMMQTEGIHRVLVIEDDDLVGILSSLDIARAAGDHRFATRTYVFNHDADFGNRVR